MKLYGAILERLMLTGKPSPGEAAISMIQERCLQLQSIAILSGVATPGPIGAQALVNF